MKALRAVLAFVITAGQPAGAFEPGIGDMEIR